MLGVHFLLNYKFVFSSFGRNSKYIRQMSESSLLSCVRAITITNK